MSDNGTLMTPVTSTTLIAMFLSHQMGRSFSACTVRRRRASLEGFARWCDPLDIGHADTVMVEDWIATLGAPRTRHAYRSDLNALYTWAIKRRLLTDNPVADTDSIRIPKSLPAPVPAAAVRNIIALAPDEPLRTGLALATYAGLRRSEVVNLMNGDVSLYASPPMLVVRNGKWGRDRQVPVHPELAVHLERRRPVGQVVPMTADTFGRRASAHIRSCGYDMTVHHLRATFATELSRNSNGNVILVGQMLGHSSPETTMLYIGLDNAAAGAASVSGMYPQPKIKRP